MLDGDVDRRAAPTALDMSRRPDHNSDPSRSGLLVGGRSLVSLGLSADGVIVARVATIVTCPFIGRARRACLLGRAFVLPLVAPLAFTRRRLWHVAVGRADVVWWADA